MGRGWLRIVAAVLLLLPVPALADGMFFPERVRPVPLRIPAQRAILVFRNGVESLTVESTLDAKGQSFGWVVPVPAKPTAVEQATRGPLDVLDRATEPEIIHETGFARSSPAWVFLLLSFVLLSRGALVLLGWESRGFKVVFLLAFVLLFLPLVALPNLGARRTLGSAGGVSLSPSHQGTPGVRADATRRVGSYEVTVLRADDADALGRWLEGNGFAALPDAGKPIVDAHVREGWSFVAVRLAREDEGRAAPHPLRIVFPAKEPIYPMRLTALAGGTTAVRLYVIADVGRIAAGLKVIFRDRYRRGPVVARGVGFERNLNHPRLLPDLWDGCVLTHLDGDFRPADMGSDLVLAAGASTPLLARFWSEKGARDEAAAWTLVPWAALALVLLFIPPAFLPLKGRQGGPFLPCLLAVSLAAGGAFLLIRTSLPTIEVKTVSRFRGDLQRYPGAFTPQEVTALSGMSNAAIEEFLGARLPLGDSPGQAELIEAGVSRVVRFYDGMGDPTDWTIPPAPKEAR